MKHDEDMLTDFGLVIAIITVSAIIIFTMWWIA